MDFELERERLLRLATSASDESGSTVLCDAFLIESVLKNAAVCIPEDAVFVGSSLHLNVMRDAVESRVGSLGEKLRAREDLKPHFAAQEVRAYTGLHDFGHTAPDWENVYRLGLPGLLERLKTAEKSAASEAERDFCSAGIRVWSAALEYVERMAKSAYVCGKAEMAEGLFALTKRAPEHFFEAMQLSFLYYDLQQHVEQSFVRTMGRLDRLLFPYFERDLEKGILTPASAASLIDAFLCAWDARRIKANAPFSVGGSFGEEGSCVNALSYLLLERHVALGLPNVKVHILYTPDMPRDFLRIAFEGIRNGSNSIVFLNDRRVTASLEALGMSPEDACRYDVVGCYEPCAKGEVPCSCNGRVNLARAVEAAFVDCGRTAANSFLDFLGLFYARMEDFCRGSMALVDAWEENVPDLHSAPFFSATFDDCVQKKADVYAHGGARYCNSSINLVGLATAVDSLLAVKKAVFEDGILTLRQFFSVLQENWEGQEALRQRILKTYPKYGLGDPEADSLAREIVERAAKLVNGCPNTKGGVYRLGGFSIDWRIGFGKRMGASADGRLAGEPISKNLCASVGANRQGVTAEILSAASLNGEALPNGSVLDLVVHSSSASGEDGLAALEVTLETYMRLGGMGLQYSVLNADALRAAQRRPEDYPHLQVRVCGWNARFTSLSEVEQNEFIRQSEC